MADRASSALHTKMNENSYWLVNCSSCYQYCPRSVHIIIEVAEANIDSDDFIQDYDLSNFGALQISETPKCVIKSRSRTIYSACLIEFPLVAQWTSTRCCGRYRHLILR